MFRIRGNAPGQASDLINSSDTQTPRVRAEPSGAIPGIPTQVAKCGPSNLAIESAQSALPAPRPNRKPQPITGAQILQWKKKTPDEYKLEKSVFFWAQKNGIDPESARIFLTDSGLTLRGEQRFEYEKHLASFVPTLAPQDVDAERLHKVQEIGREHPRYPREYSVTYATRLYKQYPDLNERELMYLSGADLDRVQNMMRLSHTTIRETSAPAIPLPVAATNEKEDADAERLDKLRAMGRALPRHTREPSITYARRLHKQYPELNDQDLVDLSGVDLDLVQNKMLFCNTNIRETSAPAIPLPVAATNEKEDADAERLDKLRAMGRALPRHTREPSITYARRLHKQYPELNDQDLVYLSGVDLDLVQNKMRFCNTNIRETSAPAIPLPVAAKNEKEDADAERLHKVQEIGREHPRRPTEYPITYARRLHKQYPELNDQDLVDLSGADLDLVQNMMRLSYTTIRETSAFVPHILQKTVGQSTLAPQTAGNNDAVGLATTAALSGPTEIGAEILKQTRAPRAHDNDILFDAMHEAGIAIFPDETETPAQAIPLPAVMVNSRTKESADAERRHKVQAMGRALPRHPKEYSVTYAKRLHKQYPELNDRDLVYLSGADLDRVQDMMRFSHTTITNEKEDADAERLDKLRAMGCGLPRHTGEHPITYARRLHKQYPELNDRDLEFLSGADLDRVQDMMRFSHMTITNEKEDADAERLHKVQATEFAKHLKQVDAPISAEMLAKSQAYQDLLANPEALAAVVNVSDYSVTTIRDIRALGQLSDALQSKASGYRDPELNEQGLQEIKRARTILKNPDRLAALVARDYRDRCIGLMIYRNMPGRVVIESAIALPTNLDGILAELKKQLLVNAGPSRTLVAGYNAADKYVHGLLEPVFGDLPPVSRAARKTSRAQAEITDEDVRALEAVVLKDNESAPSYSTVDRQALAALLHDEPALTRSPVTRATTIINPATDGVMSPRYGGVKRSQPTEEAAVSPKQPRTMAETVPASPFFPNFPLSPDTPVLTLSPMHQNPQQVESLLIEQAAQAIKQELNLELYPDFPPAQPGSGPTGITPSMAGIGLNEQAQARFDGRVMSVPAWVQEMRAGELDHQLYALGERLLTRLPAWPTKRPLLVLDSDASDVFACYQGGQKISVNDLEWAASLNAVAVCRSLDGGAYAAASRAANGRVMLDPKAGDDTSLFDAVLVAMGNRHRQFLRKLGIRPKGFGREANAHIVMELRKAVAHYMDTHRSEVTQDIQALQQQWFEQDEISSESESSPLAMEVADAPPPESQTEPHTAMEIEAESSPSTIAEREVGSVEINAHSLADQTGPQPP
ncbi:hypothetical protein ACV22V_32025, partial [Burkholderia sp. AW33-5]